MKITTERAEELAGIVNVGGIGAPTANEVADSLRALVKERDEQAHEIACLKKTISNLEARDIHSCGPDCQRSGCVNRRLREQLYAAEKERDELIAANKLMADDLVDRHDRHCAVAEQLAAAQAVIADQEPIAWLLWAEHEGNWFKHASVGKTRPIENEYVRVIGPLYSKTDDAAMLSMLAEQWENAAALCEESDRYRGDYFAALLRAEAEKLRKQPGQGAAA